MQNQNCFKMVHYFSKKIHPGLSLINMQLHELSVVYQQIRMEPISFIF